MSPPSIPEQTTTGIVVRHATVDDARVLADNNKAMAFETESLELDDTTILQGCRAILSDPSKGFYLVATAGSGADAAIVGQLMITYEWSDWRNKTTWWIQSVYVVPGSRGQGVFKSLYKHVRELCEREDGAGLRLYADESNHKAQGVYSRLGMTTHYLVFEDMFE
jgi:GNAT superfamily N-acetyltransferase